MRGASTPDDMRQSGSRAPRNEGLQPAASCDPMMVCMSRSVRGHLLRSSVRLYTGHYEAAGTLYLFDMTRI